MTVLVDWPPLKTAENVSHRSGEWRIPQALASSGIPSGIPSVLPLVLYPVCTLFVPCYSDPARCRVMPHVSKKAINTVISVETKRPELTSDQRVPGSSPGRCTTFPTARLHQAHQARADGRAPFPPILQVTTTSLGMSATRRAGSGGYPLEAKTKGSTPHRAAPGFDGGGSSALAPPSKARFRFATAWRRRHSICPLTLRRSSLAHFSRSRHRSGGIRSRKALRSSDAMDQE